MIDLDSIESLIAIERTGTVHAAASTLGFTASAVSQQVKRLERDLGVRLLEREGRGVVLTAAGRRVADEGRSLRVQIETLRSGLHDAGDRPTGTIRLGAFATGVRGLVPELISHAHENAPDLRVVIDEIDPWDAVAAVTAGSLDVALIHHWEGVGITLPPSLRSEELFRDVADLLVHRDDPAASRDAVTPHDVHDRSWACTPDGTICHDWFRHMFQNEPHTPHIDYRCLEFASQTALVASGLAVALVPRLGRGILPDNVVAVPVHEPVPTRPVSLAWRASMTSAPAVRYLRSALRELSPQQHELSGAK
ncbi:DNA-binding transcriptional LysR family regulator [Microbacterium halimionae]|uniref:DNA-binding transcriptional LysR family regulator n=1 Tax=Microbacterium halimionae TaxID=1526413 RepID=A0A7W3JLK2_9MICO|nr:LysR family transcriptional regulator [Microbacterium halimionae]MBA8815050.1 DNA-binding transcriptional LysR family regulator [Microbacterium halimionae]NII94159.1 DNA-binding transcriptional LysR family regulator [Microbacterium halimionae]